MIRCVNASSGESVYFVEAEALACGNDISVTVCGGTGYHVGAVALAVYEPERDSATVSVVTVHTHRDDKVAAHFAKEISREMKCTVSVSAGIHIDDASTDELEKLWHNSVECCSRLINELRAKESI